MYSHTKKRIRRFCSSAFFVFYFLFISSPAFTVSLHHSFSSDTLIVYPTFADETPPDRQQLTAYRAIDINNDRVFQGQFDGTRILFPDLLTGVSESPASILLQAAMGPAGYQPGGNRIVLWFSLPDAGSIDLDIYNILGQRVLQTTRRLQSGIWKMPLSLGTAASGRYYWSLRFNSKRLSPEKGTGSFYHHRNGGRAGFFTPEQTSQIQKSAWYRDPSVLDKAMTAIPLQIFLSGPVIEDTLVQIDWNGNPVEVTLREIIDITAVPKQVKEEGDTVRIDLGACARAATGGVGFEIKDVSSNVTAKLDNGVLLVYGKDPLSNGPWTASYKVTAPHGTEKGSAVLGSFLPVADVYGTFKDIVLIAPEQNLDVLFNSKRTKTGPDGRFNIQLEPGTYEMNIDTTGKGMLNTTYEKLDVGTQDIDLDKTLTDAGFLPVLYSNEAIPLMVNVMQASGGDGKTRAMNSSWLKASSRNGKPASDTLKTLIVYNSERIPIPSNRNDHLRKLPSAVNHANRGYIFVQPYDQATKLDTVLNSKKEEINLFDDFIFNNNLEKYKDHDYIIMCVDHNADLNSINPGKNQYALKAGAMIRYSTLGIDPQVGLSELTTSTQYTQDSASWLSEFSKGTVYHSYLDGMQDFIGFIENISYRGIQTSKEGFVGSKHGLPNGSILYFSPGGEKKIEIRDLPFQ